ncbi:hypothetical protein [Mastigocoleus sp. MO_188.B34]|uniref:hypothetical protein n=1 Tax=Mastigocoleus sp. MO_188.B34 TaxID=3036635 RepID=UPI00260C0708|nr:hypothetical protein [Mastigocoleus sp. MO_188.B34]MDJ0697722.1 hypothetical protein [Mastigocoleus sp. MO_188.B34]
MDPILETAKNLHAELLDFILSAEDDLATALETFSAEQLAKFSQSQYQGTSQNEMVVSMFINEGVVNDKTPIDIFLTEHPELSDIQNQLIQNWRRSFVGLFAVTQILSDGFELMNWMTAKNYTLKPKNESEIQLLARVKDGEILLTRISPVTDSYWMFSGPITLMGKLGKPKLSVAIGNFKQHYKNHLYGDAPEMLEEAWVSVERYHKSFTEFFGSDEVTLSGYKLEKKLAEFQDRITQNKLDAAGIDSSKSLSELAQEAGVSQEEIQETAESIGIDGKVAKKLFNADSSAKMVLPKVELPNHLKKLEQVTVINHPRWGQVFLANHAKLKIFLTESDGQNNPDLEKLIREYLESPEINTAIWQRLKNEYPKQLENVLQVVLKRPEFNIKADLEDLLRQFDKSEQPELPEIASVPIHLHNLFQEALREVNKKQKSKSKGKGKSKAGFGFKS